MEIDNLPDHLVYSPQVIDFVTVTAETCLLLEHAGEHGYEDFVEKSLRLLSMLYLKSILLSVPERVFDDATERFVTEDDYNDVKDAVAVLMGGKDSFLETFHPDMSLSDTPIAAFISENMADIYQELKDFAANYQLGETDIMNDALADCLTAFAEHWGQKVVSALHTLRYSYDFGLNDDEEELQPALKMNRNAFLGFLRDDDDAVNPLL
ncbi:MAG: DUF5063 domain-containing protein [Bacteroidales bacterium]|nr:DUF5063 domain-containing protein [Bacteroidales bacterium]